MCDGQKDCPDGEDEINCISWCEKTGTTCWSHTHPYFIGSYFCRVEDKGDLLRHLLPPGFQVDSCVKAEQHVFPGLRCVTDAPTVTTVPMKVHAQSWFLLLKVASTNKKKYKLEKM